MSVERRKILILGGNVAQVPLIKASKREGYYVVLVDYTTTNPGIVLVDKHYQVNFMDREKVLEIARKERVEGVISNSEAAMTVVAYVSEQLNLVGNTLESILNVTSKIGFRALQKRIGAYAPEHILTDSFENALQMADHLTFPIVIKPSMSSGSRGTTPVMEKAQFEEYRAEWEACSQYSLDGKVVLEEYMQMLIPGETVEAEVFVCNGAYLWDGIFTNLRPLEALSVPMTDIFPPLITQAQICEVKETIQHLFQSAGIVFGEYNVEMFYTTAGKLFCIEINARQGGIGLPDMIGKYTGVDMHKLLITTVMGDNTYFEQLLREQRQGKYLIRHQVYSRKDGELEQLYIAPSLQPYVTEIHFEVNPGEMVDAYQAPKDMIAWLDFEFENREQQMEAARTLEENVYPIIKNGYCE